MLGNKVESIKESLQSTDSPQVIVIPSDAFPATKDDEIEQSSTKKKELLKEAGLWFV